MRKERSVAPDVLQEDFRGSCHGYVPNGVRKHYGVTGDLLGQPILADLPGVRIYVNGAGGAAMCYKTSAQQGIGACSRSNLARPAGVLIWGDGKGSHRGRTCTAIRTARLDTSAAAAVGVDLARPPGAALLSR